MPLQPFDDALRIISHARGRRVVHVCENGVKHRPRTLHQPLNVLIGLAVYVRKEEKLLVSLDHEPGEMHSTEIVLRRREIGHQLRQLPGKRLGNGWTLYREVNDEMTLPH